MFFFIFYLLSRNTQLLGKPPLPHKTQKNNTVFQGRGGDHAHEIVLFKAKLHNSGRAGISFKQLKKIKQDNRM